MTIPLYDIHAILPEIYILTSVCYLLVYGVLYSTSFQKGYPLIHYNVGWLSFQVIFFAFLITSVSPCWDLSCWNHLLINDFFVFGSKLLILGFALCWFILALPYIVNEKINSFEFWVLILLATVGMLFIVQSYDLLSMYLSVEFQSLLFYVLASFKRTSEFSTEAGLKYFVLGAFSSALLLFGSSVLYSLTGLTNFNDYSVLFAGSLNDFHSLSYGTILGLIFVNTALLFKLSAAPFHMWSPDVYEGSPTVVTALFSILPKLGILTLLLRFCIFGFHDFLLTWQSITIFCSYLSILIGTLSAFSQKKWKRFLAYSSINHIGFFLIGLSSGELEGIFSVLFYLISYAIMTFGVFFLLVGLRYYEYPNHFQMRYISEIKGLALSSPMMAITLTVLLFSMAGIPPLVGFFAKFFVLFSGLQNNMYGLCIFSVLMSCIACFYYIRLIKIMYFDKPETWSIVYPTEKLTSISLGIFTFLTIFLSIDLELISFFLTRMALPVLF